MATDITPAEAAAYLSRVDDLSEGELTNMLHPYVETRRVKADSETFLKALSDQLKKWLDVHPGDELVDGEHGISAALQERRGTPAYDLIAISEKDPVLFERLLKTGCLQVNAAAVKAQGVQVAGVEKYASPTPVTTALIVKEGK